MNEFWLQAFVGGGGIFALIRYIISENSKTQKAFLDHLEKKNGHLERVAGRFDETVNKFSVKISDLTMEVKRQNDDYNRS